MTRSTTFIALLRGINVSGRNKILMADLRALAAEIGFVDPQTYIQSGNLVFAASGKAALLERKLATAIERQFQLSIPVIIRAAAAWPAYLAGNPFPDASDREPNRVMLGLSKSLPAPDAAAALTERCTAGERVAQVGDAIWIHFPDGVAGSKLSPALFDRLVGSTVTSRNWRTVVKLNDMITS